MMEENPAVLEAVKNKDHKATRDSDFSAVLLLTGGFGTLQKVVFSVQCIVTIFYAFLLMGPIFFTLTPQHWCAPHPQTSHLLSQKFMNDSRMFIEEFYTAYLVNETESKFDLLLPRENSSCEDLDRRKCKEVNVTEEAVLLNIDNEILIEKYIKSLTVPRKVGKDEFEQCLQYHVNWQEILVPGELILPNESWPTVPCQHDWKFDYSLYYPSISSEMRWVCTDSFKVPASQATAFLGSILGGPLFGWLADTWGRRTAIIASNMLVGVAGVAAALSPNFITYCVSIFFLGFNAYPQVNILYILAMEFVISQHRSFVAVVPFMVFLTLGFTIIPWLAYYIANWRILALVIYGPLLLSPILYKILPESMRWLISKGRHHDALDTLLKVARFNGVQLDPQATQSLADFVKSQTASKNVSARHLWKTRRLRKHFLALCVLIICARILYDSHVRIIQFSTYNFFVTFSVSSVLEVLSGLLAYSLAEKAGRRRSLSMMFFFSAFVEICSAFVVQESFVVHTSLLLVGRVSISAAVSICFMLPVEILPTVIRSQAVGVVHTLGFTMSFVSPYIVFLANWNKIVALMVLGAIGTCGGLTVLLLPETKGQNLPDTLQEGEDFGKNQVHLIWKMKKKNEA
ncbi:Major facilitator sugar transporter-like [Trinorchestia longiramus]|nr:Major facilitator sugar transporter-like [Trinorchestia longiramus]